MPGTLRILSIDGGGIRGIIPALVLQRIEERTGTRVADLFHMISGTSTGGILASALCAPGSDGRPRYTAAELVDLYRNQGREIFRRSLWHGVTSLAGTVDEKYSAEPLAGILGQRFGDLQLSDALLDLLVTSYDIERRNPLFFKSWKARGEHLRAGERAAQRQFALKDVARATSAAPTYFEPALVRNAAGEPFALVDGGVFANNPAMCAVASARVLYPRARRYLIVSLGTGQTERPIPYHSARDWGLLGWARPILSVIFDGVSDTVDYQLQQLYGTDYHRFQIELGADPEDPNAPNDDMDDASPENLQRLAARAQVMMRARADSLSRLVRQLRQPRTPRAQLAPA